MKNFFLKYYACAILLLFILYNLIFCHLQIRGPLYQIFIEITICIHVLLLFQFSKTMKYKGTICLIYFLIWLFSKDVLQGLLAHSNIVFLCITGFGENIHMKIITIGMFLFNTIFFIPITFIFLIHLNIENKGDIYKDTHYLCENHYEVYSFSQGAMDSFHYGTEKYYKILHIDGMIDITYRKRKERSKQEYEEYIKNHTCDLVGDQNGLA